MLAGKHVTLIIGGGIAAYKSLDLIRKLRRAGAHVTPVLTRAGAEFVTPLSVAALAGEQVYQDLFDLKDETEMGHIQLSRAADLLVVAPATADMMAKMAGGHADDLATTLLLATDKPVLIAPAMNLRMWDHAATRRNLAQLRADGVGVVGPDSGDMACGEFGPGRMAEPDAILDAIAAGFASGPLAGKRVLVTSGPTHEPIDPVRYIANRSSGAQGTAIATALRDLGADVVFVTGPASVAHPTGVHVVAVETARDMLQAVHDALPVDAAVMAAAVADWRVENAFTQKIKKTTQATPELMFSENPDILKTVSSHELRPKLVIGFAAETENVVANATTKRARKGCDWIVANDVSPATGIMGGAENSVHLVTAHGVEDWPRMPKTDVARQLADRIAKALT
ncbi:MAG: bifunctional phosphopantothenoylcysteine decarboxylase/phosphopantothenate--cysteine ligase CoaBC [Rhodobacteraceae bacterium]|nr:bifunctional phosphopantothenoylcysteine decarboxylase/phosphopantothenate--cysteine ligase CoaBC [Paracoccaceae bacterium]